MHAWMHGCRSICQRGTNFENFFFFITSLVDEGKKDPNTTISGPSSFAGVLMMIFHGIQTSIAKKICIFVILQGGGGGSGHPGLPSGFLHDLNF